MSNRLDSLLGCRCYGKCLDLGCGKNITPPFADGIDIQDCGQRFICDIDNDKFPIHNETYDTIHAWNVLEHIRNKVHVLNECHRVIKRGGIMEVVVPDFAHHVETAIADPTHISFWVAGTFSQYLCGTRGLNLMISKWEMVECRNYTEVNDNLLIVKMRRPK